MKNSENIQKAISLYLADNTIVCKDLANKLALTESTVGRWISGYSKTIRNIHWYKLKCLISPYLPDEYKSNNDNSIEAIPSEIKQLLEKYNSLDSNTKRELANVKIRELMEKLDLIKSI